ncbi:MAG TPA: urease accessory protein UreE [Xanthobacteraceae bacterium]|nr:urease accessory protein UreE [Xanthobacteraceae bacterium]
MPRTQKVLAKGAPSGAPVGAPVGEIMDTLLLKFDDRRKQQGFVFGGKGTCIEFDFPAPPCLHTDDLLVLDDGKLVEVVADIEPMLEVRAKDFAAIARLVLALGNRHVPVQILTNRIRLQKRPEIELLVTEHGLGAVEMTAPFEPDDGAHGHDHDHGYDHDHGHHDHHHGHEQRGHEHDPDHDHNHPRGHDHRHHK